MINNPDEMIIKMVEIAAMVQSTDRGGDDPHALACANKRTCSGCANKRTCSGCANKGTYKYI